MVGIQHTMGRQISAMQHSASHQTGGGQQGASQQVAAIQQGACQQMLGMHQVAAQITGAQQNTGQMGWSQPAGASAHSSVIGGLGSCQAPQTPMYRTLSSGMGSGSPGLMGSSSSGMGMQPTIGASGVGMMSASPLAASASMAASPRALAPGSASAGGAALGLPPQLTPQMSSQFMPQMSRQLTTEPLTEVERMEAELNRLRDDTKRLRNQLVERRFPQWLIEDKVDHWSHEVQRADAAIKGLNHEIVYLEQHGVLPAPIAAVHAAQEEQAVQTMQAAHGPAS